MLGVAAEEMLHWALVNNLLTAVGSAPYVARPHMPHQAKGYPAGRAARPRALRRAGAATLPLPRAPRGHGARTTPKASSRPGRPCRSWRRTDIVPWGQEFDTVGHLYRSIQAGLVNLADKLGEDRLFIGPRDAQATPESFRWPHLVPITDAESACRAIDDIVEQGEGATRRLARGRTTAASSPSWRSYARSRPPTPRFEPAHPVAAAGVRPVDGVLPPRSSITDPVTAAVSDLFNVNYDLIAPDARALLRQCRRGPTSSSAAGRTAVTLDVRRDQAARPAARHPAGRAGASRASPPAPTSSSSTRRASCCPTGGRRGSASRERLDEAAEFADGIVAPEAVRAVLDRVGTQLHQLATAIAAWIDD